MPFKKVFSLERPWGFCFFAAIIFACITIAVFFPTLSQGKVPLPTDLVYDYLLDERREGENVWTRDTVVQIVPYADFVFQQWKAGVIPGEHAFLYGRSADIAASGQVDIWSPVNLLIPLFQDSLSFYALKIIFYFWLSGLAFSLFLRSLKLHPAIAIFGGVSYQWAGPMIAWLSWAVIDGAWAWLPLSLLAAWQYITQAPRLRWLILGGLGWWGMVSAGHLQFAGLAAAVDCMFTASIFFAVRPRWSARIWMQVGVFILLCICVALWVALPFLFASPESHRATLSGASSLHIANLLQFLHPNIWGLPNMFRAPHNAIETTAAVGVVPLVLILFRTIALPIWPRLLELFWAALGGGVLLAMVFPALLTPLYWVAPQFESYPLFRGLMIVSMSIVMLGAISLHQIIQHREHVRWTWFAGTAVYAIIIGVPLPVSVVAAERVADNFLSAQLPLATVIVSIAMLLLYLLIQRPQWSEMLLWVFPLIALVDLSFSFATYNPQQSREPLYNPPEYVQFLQQQNSSEDPLLIYSEVSPLNIYMYYGIASLFGYDSNYPEQIYQEYAERATVKSDRNILNVQFEHDDQEYLQTRGVDYIVTKREWEGLPLMHESDGVRVYALQ